MAETPQDPREQLRIALANADRNVARVRASGGYDTGNEAFILSELRTAARAVLALPAPGGTPDTTEAARDEADWAVADALVPAPVDEKFMDGTYVDVWGHLRTDRPT